jgi:HEPN domain-containing protein
MNIEEQINYWIKTAEYDLPVAEHLYESGYYIWCLFIGHLVLEKNIKSSLC